MSPAKRACPGSLVEDEAQKPAPKPAKNPMNAHKAQAKKSCRVAAECAQDPDPSNWQSEQWRYAHRQAPEQWPRV